MFASASAPDRTANSDRRDIITMAVLASVKVPTLPLTGDADMSTPPSLLRLVAKQLPNCEVFIVHEFGHPVYWERPDIFNRIRAPISRQTFAIAKFPSFVRWAHVVPSPARARSMDRVDLRVSGRGLTALSDRTQTRHLRAFCDLAIARRNDDKRRDFVEQSQAERIA